MLRIKGANRPLSRRVHENRFKRHPWRQAGDDRARRRMFPDTPQTPGHLPTGWPLPMIDFMCPVRNWRRRPGCNFELLKPEMALDAHGVKSTIVLVRRRAYPRRPGPQGQRPAPRRWPICRISMMKPANSRT